MPLKITIVVRPDYQDLQRLASAVRIANGAQRFFVLTVVQDDKFAPEAELKARSAAKYLEGKYLGAKVIGVSSAPFDDNWFSHEYRDSCVMSSADWETVYAPPSLRAYFIYQLAQAMLHFGADLSEEMAMSLVHEPPVGCLLDMCVNKPMIRLGMVAGSLCPQCAAALLQLGTSREAIDAVERILQHVRAEATGRPILFEPHEAFVAMRFTANDENDHAYRYGIKPGLEDVGLTCMRGDNRVESGQILEKVRKHIERARFVVVKVDENNLNVFFELGLAMGAAKDTLLISSSDLVMNLPSDLRNWECLTYPEGNFEALREGVATFFLKNYHLVKAGNGK
ncbi:MAG: hypothetical protein IT363_13685 [Methanoregulaceae archaeon]|nr:hypothetical protein [Methanoregulaceae archaeon]